MIVREKESIEYLKECFKVEDGVLLWSETRPESHFIGRNRKLNSNNSSGNNGVTFSKASNKWQASIWTEGKSVYLGQYETKEEAALVSKQYRDDLGYSQRHGQRK